MFDVKIDISPVVIRYFNLILMASIVGLLCYDHYNPDNTWATSVIWGIVFLLFFSFMTWVFNYLKRKDKEEQVVRELERDKLAKMNRLANGALEFFRTLDQQKLQAAIDLYKHPMRKDQWQNERYVSFGQGPASQWAYYEDCTNRSVYPERRFITCTNELESYNGSIRHFEIDPLFYAILENYVINGKDNYPEGFDIMKYAKCYGIE